MTEEARIQFLIVEDEQSIRRLCTTIGASLGLACLEADSAEAALQQIEAHAPELIVTDLKLPALSGTDLLREVRKLLPSSEIAIMTGHGSIESAVDAMKLGAYDYIEKPFRVEKLRLLLQRMAEKVRLPLQEAAQRQIALSQGAYERIRENIKFNGTKHSLEN